MEKQTENIYKKTRFSLIWSNLVNEPFITLQTYIPFLLTKSLGASSFWIVLVTMLRPVVSIFSFAWSSRITNIKESLRSNLVQAGILARIPFLLFPVVQHPAYIVFAAAMYVLFSRASIPAWMEILKLNLPKEKRERLFSFGWVLGYIEGIIIALGLGALMDAHSGSWAYLFAISALVGMTSVVAHYLMPIRGEEQHSNYNEDIQQSLAQLLQPWKDCIHLIKTKPQFAKFQWGFMAGGFGVMLMQPALPLFFNNELQLSYVKFSIAITMCKGLGIVLSSPLWARSLSTRNTLQLASVVCIGFALFPISLFFSPLQIGWLYIAYLLYGIAQGGSHLIWHLSGPIFSKDEESSRYTGVNIVMVGVRGLIAPVLGGILCSLFGPLTVFAIGASCCCYGSYFMFKNSKEQVAA